MTDKELFEHYAGLAMQALLTHHGCYDEIRNHDIEPYTNIEVANAAVVYAETLVQRVRPNV
jgi:hypothetical protein